MKSTTSSEGSKPAVALAGFDPSYTFNDGDLVLRSADGVNFRVHSLILKLASSVFRDMLDIPANAPHAAEKSKRELSKGPILATEPACVLRILLNILYPGAPQILDIDIIDSPDLLRSLARAARKYDMPSVNEALCACIVSRDIIAKFHPVELYGVAWNMRFMREAMLLSTETLRCNLNAPEMFPILKMIDTEGVVKLQILHRRRKVLMLNALHGMTGELAFATDASDVESPGPAPVAGVTFTFTTPDCWSDPTNVLKKKLAWMTFKFEVMRTMDEQPAGSPLTQFGGDFYSDSRFSDAEGLVKMEELTKEMARILGALPRQIEI